MDWTRLSADLALLAFLMAWGLRAYAECMPVALWARCERWTYAAGGVLMVVHVLVAYGLFHRWSHSAALAHTAEQTRQVVGWAFAGGLYFNFLFVAVYLADIAWRARVGGWKQRKPRAIAYTIDSCLWFIVAMSTVVFESGVVRWVAVTGAVVVLFGIWQGIHAQPNTKIKT